MINGEATAGESVVFRVDASVSITVTADPTVLAQRHAERVGELANDAEYAKNGCKRTSDTDQIIAALQKAIMLAGEKVIEAMRAGPTGGTAGGAEH